MVANVLLRMPIDESDGHLLFEVAPGDVGADVELTANAGGQKIAQASMSLADAVDRLRPAINTVLSRLGASPNAPDEIHLEFGLTVGAETGLCIARGTAQASFTVSLTWQKRARPSGSTGEQALSG